MFSHLVKGPKEAMLEIHDEELTRTFFKTDKLAFGVSEIGIGKSSILDPGHQGAEEVFYLARGHVVCKLPDENTFHEVEKGQAMLIPSGASHQVFNIGEEKAVIVWVCAPHT